MDISILWIYKACLVLQLFTIVSSSVTFSLEFKQFNNPSNREMDGDCCDNLIGSCTNGCDCRFTFCLHTLDSSTDMSRCHYGKASTNQISSLKHFSFKPILPRAISNPVIRTIDSWPGGIRLKIEVWDVDSNNADDLVDRYYKDLIQRADPDVQSAQTFTYVLNGPGYSTTSVKLKVYCNRNYYGRNCNALCIPQDTSAGHWRCDPRTGAKVCIDGYGGMDCRLDLNECSSNPCKNGAPCADLLNGYRCSCLPGWGGNQCDIDIDECASRPCQHNSTCVAEATNKYTCLCLPGYSGYNCEYETNECTSAPCKNGGECVDRVGLFQCYCPPGFNGTQCELNIQECNSAPCMNGGRCYDGIANFTCECVPGFIGIYCEYETKECASGPCQNGATCTDIGAGYECTCLPGYGGINCQYDINECESSPCLNGGTCFDLLDRYECKCLLSFEGQRCEVNINECSNNPCRNLATCNDLVNGFTCACAPAYQGRLCEFEFDACTSSPCMEGATCRNNMGRFYCDCPPGLMGTTCQRDINECLSQPCLNKATCTNYFGGFSCLCNAGYKGDLCEIDVNECRSEPCQNGGICIDLVNSYECSCERGFEGVNCETNIDECASSPCLNGATCLDDVNGFNCSCPIGFQGAWCQTQIDECSSRPCQYGGRCIDMIAGYRCECAPGYSGSACQTKIDRCATIRPCKNGGTCHPVDNDFRCTCRSGFGGPTCQTANFKQGTCAVNLCEHGSKCIDWENGFECVCDPGYSGSLCEIDVNDCASQPCFNNATCLDGVGSFKCLCPQGYMPPLCSEPTRNRTAIPTVKTWGGPCASSPCITGECTEQAFGAFQCQCDSYHVGSRCETLIQTALIPLPTPPQPDPCKAVPAPCLNGWCKKLKATEYSCECKPNYDGKNCEIDIQISSISLLLKGKVDNLADLSGKLSDVIIASFSGPRITRAPSVEVVIVNTKEIDSATSKEPDTEVTFYAKANDNVLPSDKLKKTFDAFDKEEMDRILSPNTRIKDMGPIKNTGAREQSTRTSILPWLLHYWYIVSIVILSLLILLIIMTVLICRKKRRYPGELDAKGNPDIYSNPAVFVAFTQDQEVEMVPTSSTPLKAGISERTFDSEDELETIINNHTTFFTSTPKDPKKT